MDGATWHSKRGGRIFPLRESNPTCFFNRLNTFCSVRPAPRKNDGSHIWPSLLGKRVEQYRKNENALRSSPHGSDRRDTGFSQLPLFGDRFRNSSFVGLKEYSSTPGYHRPWPHLWHQLTVDLLSMHLSLLEPRISYRINAFV